MYMQRAFDLNDKVAKDVMVDRTSLEVVDINSTVQEVINRYLQDGFTGFRLLRKTIRIRSLGTSTFTT